MILDEGHNIRNSRTKMAQAVYALEAQRRWVLTGTPIVCPLTNRSNCVPLTCHLDFSFIYGNDIQCFESCELQTTVGHLGSIFSFFVLSKYTRYLKEDFVETT